MMRTIENGKQRLVLTVGLVILALSAMPQVASACGRCFGTSVNNATTFGISMAMLGLLGVLGVVWGGIGLFVWSFWKRSKMLEPGDLVVTEDGDIATQDDARPG